MLLPYIYEDVRQLWPDAQGWLKHIKKGQFCIKKLVSKIIKEPLTLQSGCKKDLIKFFIICMKLHWNVNMCLEYMC